MRMLCDDVHCAHTSALSKDLINTHAYALYHIIDRQE